MDMLGSDYILLFRAHHQIGAAKIKDNPVIYDVSDVESVNDLYLVSDLMITDYSSTMFDYANLMRPMVFHMYDADSYEQDVRGLYLSPEELPGPITKTELELVDAIHRQECEFHYRDKQLEFNQKFNPYEDGNSGKRVIDMCLRALPHKRTLYERFVRYTKKTLNRMRIVWLLLRYNVLGFFRSH